MSNEFLLYLRTIINSTKDKETDEYFIEVLDDKFKNGEGFIGDLVSVAIINRNTLEKNHIIVKQQKCLDGKPMEFTEESFQNEIQFYKNIWPKLLENYKNRTGKALYFVPKCWGVSEDGIKRLTLDDLTSQGFVTFNRTKCFDDDHLSFIFRLYGTFHGLSLVYKQNYPVEYEQLVSPLHRIWKNEFESLEIHRKTITTIFKVIQDYFDFSTENGIIEKLCLYERMGNDLVCETFNENKSDGIIIHSDGWSNNFMFKYNVSQFDIRLNSFSVTMTFCQKYS